MMESVSKTWSSLALWRHKRGATALLSQLWRRTLHSSPMQELEDGLFMLLWDIENWLSELLFTVLELSDSEGDACSKLLNRDSPALQARNSGVSEMLAT